MSFHAVPCRQPPPCHPLRPRQRALHPLPLRAPAAVRPSLYLRWPAVSGARLHEEQGEEKRGQGMEGGCADTRKEGSKSEL